MLTRLLYASIIYFTHPIAKTYFACNQKKFNSTLLLLATMILVACSGAGDNSDPSNGGVPDTDVPENTLITLPPEPDSVDAGQDGFSALGFQGGNAVLTDGVIVKYRTNNTSTQQLSLFIAGCQTAATFPLVNGLVHARIITSGQTVDQTIQTLSQDPDVLYAEPNYILNRLAVPNDPRFNALYGLNNTGQTGGVIDADVDAPEAWDIETGASNEVLVAVLDSGVNLNHADLRANIWANPDEIANNGIDDDGNGFIDDVRGWDFVNNDNNPQDDLNHGSHVAGTIAAVGNNGIGVTGVSWSAKILPVKFMNQFGQGSTANSIRALDYAVAMGAQVSNLSFGGNNFSQAQYDAIAAAGAAGHVVVIAAGNSSGNSDNFPIYPAAYNLPNIISVAATDSMDNLANFSNYGATSVDLAAPGVGILSTVLNNGYANMNGTSMSTPHVTGAVALMLSRQPNLSVAEIKSILLSTVDPVTALANRTVSGGRLNLNNALLALAPSISVTTTVTPLEFSVGQTVMFSASGGTAPYTWVSSNPAIGVVDANGQFTGVSPGIVQLTVTDADGNTGSSANVTVTALALTSTASGVGVGQNMQFTATGGLAPYSWVSSSPAVATINSGTGLLSARSVGTTFITVTDSLGNSVISNAINVTDVNLTPQTALIRIGDAVQFTATNGVAPYTWQSSNNIVANINASGLLTAMAAGTTTVTVIDALGVSVGSGIIEVRELAIAPQSDTLLLGNNLQLTASGGAGPYIWTVSNPALASIDATGLLTALAPGAVTVTATDVDGFTAVSNSFTLTDSLVTIDVTPGTANVRTFNWVRFSAIGGTGPYIFSLSDPAAGTINSSTGWFQASGTVNSTTTIIATDINGDQGVSGTVTVIAGFGHH